MSNPPVQDIIDQLIFERAPWLENKSTVVSALHHALRYGLNYHQTISLATMLHPKTDTEIMRHMAELIAKHVSVHGLHHIPKTGRAIIVANHPTGIADAIMLYHVLANLRPDLYFFANSDVLRVFPQLSSLIAPVEWRKDKRTHARSRETLASVKTAMDADRLGVIFPSGRLAKRRGLSLVERDWMPSAVSIARRYDAPIIPIHISARNSVLFYLLDLIHPTLRDITLFHETLNKKNFGFSVNIGAMIAANTLEDDPHVATESLKATVMNLHRGPRYTAPKRGIRSYFKLEPARKRPA